MMPDYWTIYTLGWTLIVMLGIALLHIHRQDREISKLRDDTHVGIVRIDGSNRLVMSAALHERFEMLLRGNDELCDAVAEYALLRKGGPFTHINSGSWRENGYRGDVGDHVLEVGRNMTVRHSCDRCKHIDIAIGEESVVRSLLRDTEVRLGQLITSEQLHVHGGEVTTFRSMTPCTPASRWSTSA